jgi:hypothetical protein
MTIRFLCPHGHKLAVPDNLAGKKGRCPVCQQRVYIPMLAAGDAADEDVTGESASAEALPGRARGLWSDELPDANGGAARPGATTAPPPIPSSASPGEGSVGPAPPVLPPPAAPPGEAAQELSVIIDEPEGYQADAGKVQTSYMLAMALGALTLLCASPALRYANLLEAPNWARVVLIASAVQLIFICWMVSLPDWSTVWICMVVFAFVAALYGVAWAVITFTPEHMAVDFLDLDDNADEHFRRLAGAWCFVILVLASLLTYACGRFSGRWRKQYEMAKAMRD